MKMTEYMHGVGIAARKASAALCRASTNQKNTALLAIGDAITKDRDKLMAENEKDMIAGREKNLTEPLLDRLMFTESRFDSMVEGLHQVVTLPDPVGEISEMSYQPNGLQVGKMRTPIGVIGIIKGKVSEAWLPLQRGRFELGTFLVQNTQRQTCTDTGYQPVGRRG